MGGISGTVDGTNISSSAALTMRVGTGNWTLSELFDYFYGHELEPDATPYQVRQRIVFLSERYMRAQYEKAVSKRLGKKETDLWNAVIDLLKTTMKNVEVFNTSVCSEAKLAIFDK